MKNLMILDEDKKRGNYRYRIACECTDPDHDISFDIYSDIIRDKNTKQLILLGWEFYFEYYRSNHYNYWQRFWQGVRLIFGYKPSIYSTFLLNDNSVAAIEYIFSKYKEVKNELSD